MAPPECNIKSALAIPVLGMLRHRSDDEVPDNVQYMRLEDTK